MPWRCTGGVEVSLHAFLTSALDGGEWSDLHPGHFKLMSDNENAAYFLLR